MHKAVHQRAPPPVPVGLGGTEAAHNPEDDYDEFDAWAGDFDSDGEVEYNEPDELPTQPSAQSRPVPSIPGHNTAMPGRREVPLPPPDSRSRGREPAPLPGDNGPPNLPPSRRPPPAAPTQSVPATLKPDRSPRLPARGLPPTPEPEPCEAYEALDVEEPVTQPIASPRLPPRGVRPPPPVPDSDSEEYEALEEEEVKPPPSRSVPLPPGGRRGPAAKPVAVPAPPRNQSYDDDSPTEEYMEPVETSRISHMNAPHTPARQQNFQTEDDDEGEVYTEADEFPPQPPQPRGRVLPPPPAPDPQEDYLCPEEDLPPPTPSRQGGRAAAPPPRHEEPEEAYLCPEDDTTPSHRQMPQRTAPVLPPARRQSSTLDDMELYLDVELDDGNSRSNQLPSRGPLPVPPGGQPQRQLSEASEEIYEEPTDTPTSRREPPAPPPVQKNVHFDNSTIDDDDDDDTYTNPDEIPARGNLPSRMPPARIEDQMEEYEVVQEKPAPKAQARKLPDVPPAPARAPPSVPVPPAPRVQVPVPHVQEPDQDTYEDPSETLSPPPPPATRKAPVPERNNNEPPKRAPPTSAFQNKLFDTQRLKNQKDALKSRALNENSFVDPTAQKKEANNNDDEVDLSKLSVKDRIKMMSQGGGIKPQIPSPSPTTKTLQPKVGGPPKSPAWTPSEARRPAAVPNVGVNRLSNESTSSASSNDDSGMGGRRPDDRLPVPPSEPSRAQETQPDVDGYRWYHGPIDRKETESLLNRNGMFLVRDSATGGKTAPYTMCVFFNRRVWNLKIRLRVDINKFALGTEHEDEETFRSVAQLVQHHRRVPITLAGTDGGQIKLGDSPECEQDIYDETTMGR